MPRMILLLGLGEVKEYSYLRLRDLTPHLLETFKKLGSFNVCVSLPYEESTPVDCGKSAEVLIEGVADCLDLGRGVLDGEWIHDLRLFFAEGEEHFSEILFWGSNRPVHPARADSDTNFRSLGRPSCSPFQDLNLTL